MKSTLLSTLMLVAVGVQPVFAAQCQYGACGTENDPGIVFLMSSVQMDQGEQLKGLSGVATTGDTISKKMESYLGNKKLKVNTDSTRKGPGNTTIRPCIIPPVQRKSASFLCLQSACRIGPWVLTCCVDLCSGLPFSQSDKPDSIMDRFSR